MYIYIHIKLGFFYREVKEPGFFLQKLHAGPTLPKSEFLTGNFGEHHLSWAMKQKGSLGMFLVFLGDDILPSYMGTINNYYKDPY